MSEGSRRQPHMSSVVVVVDEDAVSLRLRLAEQEARNAESVQAGRSLEEKVVLVQETLKAKAKALASAQGGAGAEANATTISILSDVEALVANTVVLHYGCRPGGLALVETLAATTVVARACGQDRSGLFSA